MRPLLAAGALAFPFAVLVLPTGLADAQVVRTSIDVGGGVGYATNPFLVAEGQTGDDDTDSAFLEANLRPQLRIQEENSTTTIEGFLRHQQYLRRFDDATSFGASANHQSRISARTSVRAGLVVDSSILGGANFVTPVFTPPVVPGTVVPGTGVIPTQPTVPTVPGTIPGGTTGGIIDPVLDPTIPDIGLLGSRARRTTYGGSLGLDHQPSVRDTVSVGFSAQRSGYGEGLVGADFNQYVANASYSRQVNEGLTLGVQGVASFVQFDDAPDSRVYQPQIIFTQRFSSEWTLSGSLGVAISEIDSVPGFPQRGGSTTIAGNLNACRTRTRSTFCLGGSRTTSPSGFGGLSTFTAATASYSLQMGERDGLSLNAGYSRTDASQLLLAEQELLSASASWSRRVSERLRLNATVGYRDVFARDFDRKADLSGLLTLSYIIGDRS